MSFYYVVNRTVTLILLVRGVNSTGIYHFLFLLPIHELKTHYYSKTCLKRNAIVPVFFSVFTGFRFTKGCVLIKQSTKNMIA